MRALSRLAVALRCGTEATAAAVLALAPDAVVIATGSRAWIPTALDDGYDRLVSARAALDGAMVGDIVAVLDTQGDMAGPTTAEWLAAAGHRVTLVTPHRAFGQRIEPMTRHLLHERLIDRGVAILADRTVARLTEDGVVTRHTVSGAEELLAGVATVVAATGGRAEDGLARALRAAAPALRLDVVGDARSPRTVEAAIYEGQMAARAL